MTVSNHSFQLMRLLLFNKERPTRRSSGGRTGMVSKAQLVSVLILLSYMADPWPTNTRLIS